MMHAVCGWPRLRLILRTWTCWPSGITYTILAPWQAAEEIDGTEPYILPLHDGRSMTVFFYNAPLSGGISFNDSTTCDANNFASSDLQQHLVTKKRDEGKEQLILVATDGELYGHHKIWRDKFLSYLLTHGAPKHGFEVCSLERYMQMYPAKREVQLRVPQRVELCTWRCPLEHRLYLHRRGQPLEISAAQGHNKAERAWCTDL